MELCSNICLRGGIDGRCDGGMGGIVEVAITNWADDLFTAYYGTNVPPETGLPYAYAMADVDGGVCQDSANWFKFTFRRNTANMTSTLNIDDANGINYVQTDLQLIFSRMEKDKRMEIIGLSQAPVAAVVKDANGKYWALGYNEPMTASAGEGVTGTNRSDSNHYSITLTDISDTFPLPVENGAAVMEAAEF